MTVVLADIDASYPAAGGPAAMRWRRGFPGRADQAKLVRQFTAYLLADWPYADEVVYAAAELAANAIRHSRSGRPGGVFIAEVRRWRTGAAIAVTDQGGPTDPVVREADYLAESGRGLHAIAATATRWGWSGNPATRTVVAIYDHP